MADCHCLPIWKGRHYSNLSTDPGDYRSADKNTM
ncbi:uncharacterized protein METZ01_LOCUS214271, partial [marine metagenome]